jgi:hypothetical protein
MILRDLEEKSKPEEPSRLLLSHTEFFSIFEQFLKDTL